jgi:hypothetical protein
MAEQSAGYQEIGTPGEAANAGAACKGCFAFMNCSGYADIS